MTEILRERKRQNGRDREREEQKSRKTKRKNVFVRRRKMEPGDVNYDFACPSHPFSTYAIRDYLCGRLKRYPELNATARDAMNNYKAI